MNKKEKMIAERENERDAKNESENGGYGGGIFF